MKKLSIILGSLLCLFALAACGGDSTGTTKPQGGEKQFVPKEEIQSVYASPDMYKGKYIELTGKVFGSVDSTAFQFFQDVDNSENNTIVYFDTTSLGIKSDDFVKVVGKINGTFSGENTFGGTITALSINADSVEKIGYIDAVSPTIKTITPEAAQQEQHGCVLRVDKIEFAENETRVYVTAKNNSNSEMSVYTFNMKIVQGNSQFEEESNYEADYPELQSDILPGVESSGIVSFQAIDKDLDFKIVMEARNDNYRLDFKDYIFEISAK